MSLVGSQVLVDGIASGSTCAVEETKQLAQLDELGAALKAKRETWTVLYPDRPFPGVVVLQIDQDAPAVVVKRSSRPRRRPATRT